MKQLVTFLMTIVWSVAAQADVVFPKVSSGSEEHWYYIQMQNGMGVLASQGEGNRLITAEPTAAQRDRQLWKVLSASGSHYRFVTKGGQVMYYDTSAGKFQTAASPSGGYQEFQIVKTSNSTYAGYEIYVDQLGNANAYLNQWGGAGTGRELGCWSKGDVNNPLQFVAEGDMAFKDVKPGNIAEVSISGATAWTPANRHTLWYTKPATVWMTSTLPIGNGQFGACIMGGVKRDEVQFNDKTLWWGHLGSVVANGSYGSYLDFGHLYITSTDATLTKATNYRRWLDIDEARAGVAYTANGIDYTREYIASNPDQVVAFCYKASEGGHINKNLILYNANGTAPTYSIMADGTGLAVFQGEAKRTGTTRNEAFYCMVRVVAKGGNVSMADGGGLDVSGADEMTVYLFGATNFSPDNDEYLYPAAELPQNVERIVKAAVAKGYDQILADHMKDYRALYDRCQLSISTQENSVTTPTLISNFARNNAQNLLLEEMYFAYGRYLMISCSRGVDLPSNLQGIWNNSNTPAWNSDIHSNINVQMNYWPAEVTNLSELHLPFLNYIKREACDRSQWRKNAQQIAGQKKGWTLTTENNIYGSGSNWMQNYTIANAWYCMHLWQHYRYTLDTDYLWNTALPAMRSCCEYWMERLVLAKDGTYECPNEYSPEHGPDSENATAHSQQLVWDLFNNTLQAYDEYAQRTGKDFMTAELSTFLKELSAKFEKLDKGTAIETVNGKKLLREWKYTSQNNVKSYNSHRHLSHLMGLYPGNQIAEDIDKDIYQAAINSLNTRGYEGTGWSMGWKVNCHARAHDGDRCQSLLATALHIQTNTGNSEGGGVYENLWDAHTPYQIDGNFGACAGMAEMLLQSHTGKLELLPALPSAWKDGSVKGLRAVGCFEVDIDWMNGRATTVIVKSDKGEKAIIKYAEASVCFDITDNEGKTVDFEVIADNVISFNTEAGHCYTLKHNGQAVAMPVDDIADGDYVISLPESSPVAYLQQTGSTSSSVKLNTDAMAEGTVWTITAYNAADYKKFGSYTSWLDEGTVYYLFNRDKKMDIRNLFLKGTGLNITTLHPIYRNSKNGLLAIRATNIDSDQSSFDRWYGLAEDGTLTATLTEPQYCWQLVPYTTVGINSPSPFSLQDKSSQTTPASPTYDLQGRQLQTVTPQTAVYIRQNKKYVAR